MMHTCGSRRDTLPQHVCITCVHHSTCVHDWSCVTIDATHVTVDAQYTPSQCTLTLTLSLQRVALIALTLSVSECHSLSIESEDLCTYVVCLKGHSLSVSECDSLSIESRLSMEYCDMCRERYTVHKDTWYTHTAQQPAMHCNILHTAIHCNILQYSATTTVHSHVTHTQARNLALRVEHVALNRGALCVSVSASMSVSVSVSASMSVSVSVSTWNMLR